jgi:hypothetical protein
MKPTSFLLRAAAGAAAVILAGCGTMHFSSGADRGKALETDAAYAYGRFELVGGGGGAEYVGSIGLSFACEDGSTFTLGFRTGAGATQAVKVNPGVCSLRAFVFTDSTVRKSERAYTGALLKSIKFEPGTMQYIGDFQGQMKQQTLGTMVQTRWNVTDVKDAFVATTQTAQQSWPNATSFKTVNAMAAPPAAAAERSAPQASR